VILPMEIIGPVVGIGSLMMIGASAIVMIRRLAPRNAIDDRDRELLEDVHARLAELEEMRRRVGELEERVDFAERVLAKQREPQRLGPPGEP
jgi:hypothetical protein